MANINFVKIGQKSYPVAYPFSALEEMEETLGMTLAEILQGLQNPSIKRIKVIMCIGLNHGSRLQDIGKAVTYDDVMMDELFMGNLFNSYRLFAGVLTKQTGMDKVVAEEEENDTAKNQKARAKP